MAINKVFSYGKGKGPTGGIDYLMGNKDRATPPKLLRGNESVTRELLAQATGKHEYTTGCLSFEEQSSEISEQMKEEIMDMYEDTLMAGFPKEHYDIMWIEHDDKDGRLELNWHIVNQDLVNGRVLQPYFVDQDRPRMDLVKKVINDKFNLASPDDPSRTRDVNLQNNFGKRKDIQEHISRQIMAGVEKELLTSKDDIVNLINNTDGMEISRNNKSGISIKITNNDDIKKPIRFKGGIFSDRFKYGYAEYNQAKDESAREYSEQREQRLERNKERLSESIKHITETRQSLLIPPRPKSKKESIKEVEISNKLNSEESRRNTTKPRPDEFENSTDELESREALEQRDGIDRDSKQISKDIYEARDVNSAVLSDIPDNRNTNRNEFINKLKIDNDEYTNTNKKSTRDREQLNSDNETKSEGLGEAFQRAFSGAQQRVFKQIRDVIERFHKRAKSLNGANKRVTNGNEELRGTLERSGAAIGAEQKRQQELNEKVRHLDQLLGNSSSGWGIAIEQKHQEKINCGAFAATAEKLSEATKVMQQPKQQVKQATRRSEPRKIKI